MYAIVSTYVGYDKEDFADPVHNLMLRGYTDDPKKMIEIASNLFQELINDDQDRLSDSFSEEDLAEFKAAFEINIEDEEVIREQMQIHAGTHWITIGTLYNHNPHFEYVDHIIVAAIPTNTNKED